LLSPIVATLLGYLLLHQSLTITQMIGGMLVLGSVWTGQRQGEMSQESTSACKSL
jgi:probable blue pigment (indigoidine) exporter